MPPARDVQLPTLMAIPSMLVPADTLVIFMPNVLTPHCVMKQEPDEGAVKLKAVELESVPPEFLAFKMLEMLFAHPAMAMRVRLELAERHSKKLTELRKLKHKDARKNIAAEKKANKTAAAMAKTAAAAMTAPVIAVVPKFAPLSPPLPPPAKAGAVVVVNGKVVPTVAVDGLQPPPRGSASSASSSPERPGNPVELPVVFVDRYETDDGNEDEEEEDEDFQTDEATQEP